jgi:hypothetical protein
MKGQNQEVKTHEKDGVARTIEAVAWGLFFIWVGIALTIGVEKAIGLLVIGIITLGGQAARRFYDLKLEGFWVIVGCCFIVGGLWEFFSPELALVPILLIIAGLVLIYSVSKKRYKNNK